MTTIKPSTINQAIDIVLETITGNKRNKKWVDSLGPKGEQTFLSAAHHGYGMNIRNNWNLWWSPAGAGVNEKWPKKKPQIVHCFNTIGIYHADDMSGIILSSAFRKYFNQPIDLNGQVKHYQDYWDKKGIDVSKMGQ